MSIRGFFAALSGGGGGSSINVLGSTTPAPSITSKVSGTPSLPTDQAGISVGLAAATLLMPEVVSTGLASVASGAANNPTDVAGTALSTFANLGAPAEIAGGEIVQMNTTLNGDYGGTAVASNVTGTNWVTPSNASGTHDGVVSTHNGAISAQDAFLVFSFPSMVNKTDLTITAVKLRYYFQQGGTIANNGKLILSWGPVGSSFTNVVSTILNNQDASTTPVEVDLFAAGVTTWAGVADVQARIRGTLAAGATTVTQSVDAVELIVVANRTDAV